MRAFDFYLLGFVEFEVDASDFTETIALFLRNGIRIRSQCQSRLTVFRHQKSDAFKLLSERNIKYNITRKFDVFDSAADNMRLLVMISAAFLTAVIVTFLSGMVWCIEVDGNVEVSDGEIIYVLEQCGFGIGSFWSKKDIGEIENQFLLKNEEIGWININRSGTVAYVSVIESKREAVAEQKEGASNLVASRDCVIEYISVKRGTPMVKVGDAVTKGDLLVLGMNTTGDESIFCSAEAVVLGRVNETIYASTPREKQQEKTENIRLCSLKVKILNFSVNIFKKYRNLGEDCVIIEEIEKNSLLSGRKLPFEIVKEYQFVRTFEPYVLSDDELISDTEYKMMALLHDSLIGVNLNSIKTYGDFTENGYVMISEIIYTCDISERVEFSLGDR